MGTRMRNNHTCESGGTLICNCKKSPEGCGKHDLLNCQPFHNNQIHNPVKRTHRIFNGARSVLPCVWPGLSSLSVLQGNLLTRQELAPLQFFTLTSVYAEYLCKSTWARSLGFLWGHLSVPCYFPQPAVQRRKPQRTHVSFLLRRGHLVLSQKHGRHSPRSMWKTDFHLFKQAA